MSKNEKKSQPQFLFGKRNYMFMLIGLACIALGFILMAGGSSDDPNVWNDAINNFQRIRLAPTLVIVGLGIQIYAILLNPKKEK